MSSEPARDTDEVAAPRAGDDLPVFSERLSTILEDMVKGEAPNAGRFCGNCYTPIDPQRLQCAQCGQPVEKRPPVQRVPDEVLLMCRSKRRRESLVVTAAKTMLATSIDPAVARYSHGRFLAPLAAPHASRNARRM